MRDMRWSEEKAFEGFTCSDCGWLFPNPKRSDAPDVDAFQAETQAAFDSHVCAKYPRKAKAPKRGA